MGSLDVWKGSANRPEGHRLGAASRWVLLCAGLILALPALAEGQVAVQSFSGPRNARVREAVAAGLEEGGFEVMDLDASEGDDPATVAEQTGAQAVVGGRVRRRGSRFVVNVQVFDASGGTLFEGRAGSRRVNGLASRVVSAVSPTLSDALTDTEPPAEPTGGEQQRVITVAPFSGPGAAQARNQLVRALSGSYFVLPYEDVQARADELGADMGDPEGLQTVAEDLGLSAMVEGESRRRGRRFVMEVLVRSGHNGEASGSTSISARGRGAGVLARTVRSQSEEVAELITDTRAPEQGDGPPAADASGGIHAAPTDEIDPDELGSRPNFQAREALPVAFEVSAFGGVTSRRLSYNDDLYGRLRGYNLTPFGQTKGVAPTVGLQFRWYPGAHFRGGWASRFGIDASYERVFGVRSRRSDGETFDTTSQAFFVGLRGRMPFGDHEVSLVGGYGGHSFVVDANQAEGETGQNLPQVPGVDYRFVRVGLEGRLALAGFRFSLNAAYDIILDAGGIDDEEWFPLADAGGIEAGGTVGYAIPVGSDNAHIEIWFGAQFRRYFYSTNVRGDDTVSDTYIAGGILDRYRSYNLGLTWRR